jgi:hypothetical protein
VNYSIKHHLALSDYMSVTINLEDAPLFQQGMPTHVSEWLASNVGIIYHCDEIWRHNERVLERQSSRSKSLGSVLISIQAHYEYPQECSSMVMIHACGWNFTQTRKFATHANSFAVKQARTSLLRIEDDSKALHFALKWMQ